MFQLKSKKLVFLLSLCAMSAVVVPSVSQAEVGTVLAAADTGDIAASQAADQKARLAKKAADRQKAAEEKKAAEDAQKAAETPKTAVQPTP